MPFPVTHFLIPIILIDLVKNRLFKNKKILPDKYVFISGLSGLLVDADLLLFYIFQNSINLNLSSQHRIFFHNIWVPLFFLFGFIIFFIAKKKNLTIIFLMIFIGTSIHLLLDATIVNEILPFYPLSSMKIGLNLIPLSYDLGWNILARNIQILLSFDAILLIFWVVNQKKYHISDFL